MQVAIDVPGRPVLRYYGGKWRLAPWIISHFPEHVNYVEPCGGAASVLLQKPRSPLETYNDLDGNVVNFFRVLRDQPDELIRMVRLTPWARSEYELAQSPATTSLEQARRFFVMQWQARGGQPSGWRYIKNALKSDGSIRWGECAANGAVIWEQLDWMATRLKFVQIENDDALTVIDRFDNEDSLTYFDPPYLSETRVCKRQYLEEADSIFHIKAAERLRQCQGYVVVSGYACDLYRDLYEAYSWKREDRETRTLGSNRCESLWLSPRTVEALAMPEQAKLF